ncbi:hypothetical protein M3G04_01265 [Dietzia cinnamea]|uniref:hypothetical protein n=1 Tax=Dietzia cinnamea TaxID=321318 RepID=UPI00223B4077|nr:hypothetical protein [Dietzia cinnamea]MCT2299541.1 hypothetical protein [Dietzia cinnamea]
MKWILGIIGALVLWGVLQGATEVDLSQGQDTIVDAAKKIIGGAADTTILLLPKAIDALTSLVDKIPDNGSYNPPTIGE